MLNLIKVNSISSKLLPFFKKDYVMFESYLNYLQRVFPSLIIKSHINNFELELHVQKEQLLNLLWFLKKDSTSAFSILTDIVAVDLYSIAESDEERFCVMYSLLTVDFSQRLTVIVKTNENVPTCTTIYNDAHWLEREVSDLYGVVFTDSVDSRRILTDYGFFGHPLRKDFPLSGFSEVFFDPILNTVITTQVSLSQEYRDFDFSNMWEI